jgi:hypothetical protein
MILIFVIFTLDRLVKTFISLDIVYIELIYLSKNLKIKSEFLTKLIKYSIIGIINYLI